MIDIKFLRENPEIVKENIRKKFQDKKLPMVDEVIALDADRRKAQQEADELKAAKNKIAKQIGALMGQGKKQEAEEKKKEVAVNAARLAELEKKQAELEEKVNNIMMVIPNIIDPSVPVGKDDSENVEVQKYGEPVVPDFEIPYHTEIMEKVNRSGCGAESGGKRFLLPDGRYREAAFRSAFLCQGLYDRQRIYLLYSALYDSRQCGFGCYEFSGDGCHDV